MGLFQRIFKIVQAESHSVVEKLEDPIKMTEQGIRDLKKSLSESMRSLAEVKAIAIRLKKDAEDQKKMAADYERKAMLLLQKMKNGELEVAEAERLATEALAKKEEALERANTLMAEHRQQKKLADQLQMKVEKLKQMISKYENELITLKARARTAQSMRKINQQMSKMDTSSTIAMLEKMKTKVIEEESLAEAYGEIAESATSVDEEIDEVLASPSKAKASESLEELKKKMGIQ